MIGRSGDSVKGSGYLRRAAPLVQMAIMQIVDVATMFDRGVSAARAMLMLVMSVMRFVARAHAYLLCTIGRAGTSSGHRPRSGLKTSVRAMVRPRQTCLRPIHSPSNGASTGAKPARRASEPMRNEAERSSPLTKGYSQWLRRSPEWLLSKRETAQWVKRAFLRALHMPFFCPESGRMPTFACLP
jgi:hypothetical protein